MILKFQVSDIKNLGSCHGVKNGTAAVRWGNVKLCKIIIVVFTLGHTVCGILIFLTFDLENLGQGHGAEKHELRCSIENINKHKSHP